MEARTLFTMVVLQPITRATHRPACSPAAPFAAGHLRDGAVDPRASAELPVDDDCRILESVLFLYLGLMTTRLHR